MSAWINRDSYNRIMLNGVQVAEIVKVGDMIHIRNLRHNGTVGICYSADNWGDIRSWLDSNIHGWRKDA